MINSCNHIVITGHKFPDGDAVGATLALHRMLSNLGKHVDVLLYKAHIGTPRILEDFDIITDIPEYDFTKEPDLFICLDCADPSRICDDRLQHWVGRIPTVNIDHHGKKLYQTTLCLLQQDSLRYRTKHRYRDSVLKFL